MKNRGFRERAGFAVAGLRTGWWRERSFRTQFGFALLASVALVSLRPAPIWWAAVALSCGMVLTLELLNSAVEAIADLVQPDFHPEIKAIKDMRARCCSRAASRLSSAARCSSRCSARS